MASDYDQNDSSDLILGSAIKCYNSAVQQELYAFFSGNAAWDQTAAGQSEKVGYTTGRRGPGRPPLALCRAEPARL